MFSSKDYSGMALEELVSEEKKIKSQKTLTALVIGMTIGIAFWSAAHKGFVLPVLLLIFAIRLGYSNSQNLKRVQAEISRRDTVG